MFLFFSFENIYGDEYKGLSQEFKGFSQGSSHELNPDFVPLGEEGSSHQQPSLGEPSNLVDDKLLLQNNLMMSNSMPIPMPMLIQGKDGYPGDYNFFLKLNYHNPGKHWVVSEALFY